MAFQRSLARLLSLRQSLERQEEMRLALLAGRLNAARTALEAAHTQIRELSPGRLTHGGSAGGAELQAAALRQSCLAERLPHLRAQIDELAAAHQAQCRRLAACQQARKILETLRDQRAAVERLQERRREQATLDELFLLRR